MSDWRGAFFGRKTLASKLGLVEAPVRSTPSHELVAARELDQMEIEHARKIDERIVNEIRETWHQRRVEALRPLVEAFGVEAVTRISRRADPNFTLPKELLEDEDTNGH